MREERKRSLKNRKEEEENAGKERKKESKCKIKKKGKGTGDQRGYKKMGKKRSTQRRKILRILTIVKDDMKINTSSRAVRNGGKRVTEKHFEHHTMKKFDFFTIELTFASA